MLKKILQELVLIRKELQAIRSNLERHHEITIDGKELAKATQKAIRDIAQVSGGSFQSSSH